MSDIKITVEHAHIHIGAGETIDMALHALDDVRETITDKLKRILGGK